MPKFAILATNPGHNGCFSPAPVTGRILDRDVRTPGDLFLNQSFEERLP